MASRLSLLKDLQHNTKKDVLPDEGSAKRKTAQHLNFTSNKVVVTVPSTLQWGDAFYVRCPNGTLLRATVPRTNSLNGGDIIVKYKTLKQVRMFARLSTNI
jgi:hypothetical protein